MLLGRACSRRYSVLSLLALLVQKYTILTANEFFSPCAQGRGGSRRFSVYLLYWLYEYKSRSTCCSNMPGRRISVSICTFVLVKQVLLGFTRSEKPGRCARIMRACTYQRQYLYFCTSNAGKLRALGLLQLNCTRLKAAYTGSLRSQLSTDCSLRPHTMVA